MTLIQADQSNTVNFFKRCGLKSHSHLIRLRILDPKIRQELRGLCDITVPHEECIALNLLVRNLFIVENLQTRLAFSDMPDSIVIMGLGYNVEILGRIPWINNAQCIYWGDIDTHGFAILNRARSHLPNLKSLLMDKETLFLHKDLWGEENKAHGSSKLDLLTDAEQSLYHALKQQHWGHNIRLEQERID